MHAVLSDGYFKPQSPDVWSMIKYGNANIDYYTGTLGISIPIYTYKDNNFEIPISIDYASSGFQPGSPSGLVGQGWYLNFGGAITREVRGIPDDAIQEMYDDGVKDGIQQGIAATIRTCQNLNASRIETFNNVRKEYKLTEEQTEEYLNTYWK